VSAVAESRPPAIERRSLVHSVLRRRELPVGVALLVVLIGTSFANSRFLSLQGRTDLMLAAAITGMVTRVSNRKAADTGLTCPASSLATAVTA